jgi:hypothetical protein
MHSELNVLIVDPLLGTAGLMELAGKLRASVEVAEAGDVRASMPCVLSAAVTALFSVILGSGTGSSLFEMAQVLRRRWSRGARRGSPC